MYFSSTLLVIVTLSTSDPARIEKRAYDRAHLRVVRLWGKARLYPCIECGRPAQDWAYDGTDPTGEGVKRKYSIWPEFYMPMCHRCHLRRDKGSARMAHGLVVASGPNCSHPGGCPRPARRYGLCWMHHARLRRYGTLGPAGMVGKKASLEVRFANNVQINGPIPAHNPALGACSVWTGYVHVSGFGAIATGNRLIYVHRYVWEREYGPIPVGKRVGQLCLNRLCVRADHLELW
jgi:HNH endonuclease